MDSSQRRPPTRSPAPSTSPERPAPTVRPHIRRPGSSESDSSRASSSLSVHKRSPYTQQLPFFASQNAAQNIRPSAQYLPHEASSRKTSPLGLPTDWQRHRPRQHSQGFFEPSMPSASLASQSNLTDAMSLTASQIAAQAAMQHRTDSEGAHSRKRSQTVPFPEQTMQNQRRGSKDSPPPLLTQNSAQSISSVTSTDSQYRNGLVGTTAAATAANVAFPRNLGLASPPAIEEKESKKGLKRFRPKHIGISRDKEKDSKERPIPSPNKPVSSGLSRVVNASTTSLTDSVSSQGSSFYMQANPSASTIIPVNDKEKTHKHTLRQKLKLNKDEHHALPLSSASSNSRPTDANNPQSLYSFALPSPSPGSSFAKSMSGLDLRHGGRALREKKREEKAQAAAALEPVYSRRDSETTEFPTLHTLGSSNTHPSTSVFAPYANDPALREHLAGFGLNNMTADDAWDFLKAKILVVFEGEDVRIAVEDLNRLVTIHVQRCVQRRDPANIIADLDDLFRTGFLSLNHTLQKIPDERLVPHLVSMWLQVFGTILPFMQAVFLPLDLEFKGRGSVLTNPKMAAEFWGAIPSADSGSNLASQPATGEGFEATVLAGEELEVRRILLISFRDIVVLPRFDVLKATFSRLSLESINATLAHLETTGRNRGDSGGSERSVGLGPTLDPTYSSYSSQTSTLLGTNSNSNSSGARSRAISSVSATGSAQDVAFQSFHSPPAARPVESALVAETVGRMLQCLCVLGSVQTGDGPQTQMEELARQLKLNWLGRGRTGRNRKGFVGSRVRPMRSVGGSTIKPADRERDRDRDGRDGREGSPTPTPTRQGTVSRQGDDSSTVGRERREA